MSAANISMAQCAAATFGTPNLFGAEILNVQASLVTNYSSQVIAAYNSNHGAITVTDASFCNVTITYTHPGQDDTINVEAWLPTEDWNGRLEAIGGGGWVAGRFVLSYYGMAGAIGEGYATVSTDAGIAHGNAQSPVDWALTSAGNVNIYALQNLAAVSLNDMAVLAKDAITSFYGQPPAYSYWSGCSQGGRQGLMLAQRYPEAFDGIAASAPAINWSQFISTSLWPDLLMWLAGEAPQTCELDAIQAAAVAFCDPLDGVTDGLVTDPNKCSFDAFSMVGTSFNCSTTGDNMTISDIAATVANSTWSGAVSPDGKKLWYGPNVGTDLTGDTYGYGTGLVTTTCANGTCSVTPFELAGDWIKYFVEKNASFDLSKLTHEQFAHDVHQSINQYSSMIGTNDPDLTEFRNRGGKMLTFHGLADGIIPTKGTEDYYNSVTALLPDVQSFYRYFPAPGVGHCFGGPGQSPTTLFDAMRAWVENGTVPEELPVTFTDVAGRTNNRFLCPYPAQTTYNSTCGDSTISECFYCA